MGCATSDSNTINPISLPPHKNQEGSKDPANIR